ncbi:MAG: hypothetical protein AB7O43_02735 [Hyphomicrobiaceae bacterium]
MASMAFLYLLALIATGLQRSVLAAVLVFGVGVGWELAQSTVVEVQPASAAEFNMAVNTRSPAQMARVEQIKQQMEEWRRRNPGRDFGREM